MINEREREKKVFWILWQLKEPTETRMKQQRLLIGKASVIVTVVGFFLDRWQHVGRTSTTFASIDVIAQVFFLAYGMSPYITKCSFYFHCRKDQKKKSLTSYHIIDLSFNFQSHL